MATMCRSVTTSEDWFWVEVRGQRVRATLGGTRRDEGSGDNVEFRSLHLSKELMGW